MGTTRNPKPFSAGFKPARKSAVLLQAEGGLVERLAFSLRDATALELRVRPGFGAQP
jgi:hypothetical protein